MTRSQFLGLFAIPFLSKIDLLKKDKLSGRGLLYQIRENESVFNVKKIQSRIDFLRKYPLSEKECFRITKNEPWMHNYQRLVKNNIETE